MNMQVLVILASFFLNFMWADETPSLSDDDQKLISERTKGREQLRARMDRSQQRSLDAQLVNACSGITDRSQIEALLLAGADPDSVLERYDGASGWADEQILHDRENELSLETLELLFQYGGKIKPITGYEFREHRDVRLWHRQIEVSLLKQALRESIKKDDLSTLHTLVKLLKKYGFLKLKAEYWDETSGKLRCTIGAYFWREYRRCKEEESQYLCRYSDHVFGSNWEFVKTFWQTALDSWDERYNKVSKSWKETRSKIHDARVNWRTSISNSNVYSSLAMAVDPEQKEKCD